MVLENAHLRNLLDSGAFDEMPLFIVSTSAVISDGTGRVMLSKRSLEKWIDPGKWETPGGHLEHGELPLDGLRRELLEELGMEIADSQLQGVYVHYEAPLPTVIIVYAVRLQGDICLNPEEISEVRWFDEGEITSLEFAVNCRERAQDYWRKREAGEIRI
jgi:8-oxo-dGTP pyrophosphatase MutT (NUDIX family)